jgi:outer membrane protein insertion porin family
MRLKLFLAVTVATILQGTASAHGQIANVTNVATEPSQIDRLVSEPKLASVLNLNDIPTQASSEIPTAKDLLAATKRKGRRTIIKIKPAAKPPASTTPETTPPSTSTPQPPTSTTPDPANPQKQVLVAEVAIKTPSGQLQPELESKIRQVLTVKAGAPTSRPELQQNLNAIRAIGAFSAVEIIPEDTPKGVKISFVVTPYGILSQVKVRTTPTGSTTVLTPESIASIFEPRYGKQLNVVELKAAIKQLNDLYQKQGYTLAKIVDVEDLNADGTMTLVVSEGLLEDVQVRFLTKEGSAVDDKKQPISGVTRPFIITREAELKPGKVFNRNTAEKDLRRIYGLGLFDDVRASFEPGADDKVVLQFNVIERKTGSILAGGGISSTNGLFASTSYTQQNLGGNAQRLGAELQIGRDLLYDLNFSDPWIAGDPNRTSYNVNAFQRRSLSLIFDGGKTPGYIPGTLDSPRILRLGGGVTFSRPLNGDPFSDSAWRGSLGLQYQRVSTRDSGGGTIFQKDSLGNDLTFSKTGQDDLFMFQLGVNQDLRNSFADPTQGSLLKLGLDQSVPIGVGNILMTRARGSFTQYIPTKLLGTPGSQAFVFNVQGGTILGDLPPYEAFSLGGTTSIRGYEDGAVGAGRSYVQATAEYRFPLFSIVGGEIFADYGSDLGTASSVPGNPAGSRGKPGSGFGYGIGVRIQSPIGPVRVDYALNTASESRIQFGIGERF